MTNAGAAERIARELASNGHGPDAITGAEELASLLNLGDVGLTIVGGRIVGTGSKASADVYLSNGTTIIFERFGDVANPTRLMTEVVTCTGAAPALSGPDARRAAALLRVVAEHEEADTIDHQARSWGLDYLQVADTRPFDINDQASRWEAFAQLKTIDPVASNRHDPTRSVAAWSVVLVDLNGTRYVRLGWFADHVRASEQISPADIAVRMQRVGWTRRGRGGRIKATQPDFGAKLGWNFHIVVSGWEDRGE